MKFLAASLLPAFAFAGVAEIEKMLSQLGNSSAPAGGQRSQLQEPDVNNPITTTLSQIWNYGCWCYFQDNHGRGSGEAQNYMDEHCKVLHHGYTCIMMDADDEGDNNCNPFTHEYNTISILGAVPENVQIDCESRNQNDNCGIRSCAVESYFVLNVFAEHFGDNTFDPSLKHDLGWDNSVCRGTGGSGPSNPSPWACCGAYPPRFPYKTGNGRRGCCADKTYDTNMFSCCNDNAIQTAC